MLRRSVKYSEHNPKGYRIAWYDACRRERVCYPFGLHWVMRYAHMAWLWSFKYTRTDHEQECFDIIQELQMKVLKLNKACVTYKDWAVSIRKWGATLGIPSPFGVDEVLEELERLMK